MVDLPSMFITAHALLVASWPACAVAEVHLQGRRERACAERRHKDSGDSSFDHIHGRTSIHSSCHLLSPRQSCLWGRMVLSGDFLRADAWLLTSSIHFTKYYRSIRSNVPDESFPFEMQSRPLSYFGQRRLQKANDDKAYGKFVDGLVRTYPSPPFIVGMS